MWLMSVDKHMISIIMNVTSVPGFLFIPKTVLACHLGYSKPTLDLL